MKYAVTAVRLAKYAALAGLGVLALITAMERREEPYDR